MGGYKSLPFATYDLAVYLPGGAILLVLAQYSLETILGSPALAQVNHFGSDLVNTVILAILWISASYLAGHLGAYLSSIFIEKFVHTALSYPSNVWIKKEEYTAAGISCDQFTKSFLTQKISEAWNKHRSRLTSIALFVFLFPIWLPLSFFIWLKPVSFYDPKLPEGLLPDVRSEFSKISRTVKVEEGTRWEKMVEHHVANNCPLAYQRMYNYLVIYGALRLLSFIMIIAGWVIIVKSVVAFFSVDGWVLSYRRSALYFAASIGAYFAMLAFAKFNRRFFEECILALLLADNPRTKNANASYKFRSWGAIARR
ncbi:hypothetical protein CHX26_03580 [Porphyrobacter sp. HT-58-2]|nr:hypothetical protein CHX26_03580 [Porphyrobacter sp. HT-58-2]